MSLEKIAFAEPDPEILKRVRWGGGGWWGGWRALRRPLWLADEENFRFQMV